MRGFFDCDSKKRRFDEIEIISQAPDFWNDQDNATKINKERSDIEADIKLIENLNKHLKDADSAIEIAEDFVGDDQQEFAIEAETLLSSVEVILDKQDFLRKMSQEYDKYDVIVELNGGSGGTEAQDWANMLLRMYLRWAERKGFEIETLDYLPGEVAGIKSASILIKGAYAYGYLFGEQGVHRLVRISPFDSGARRHTSFASVSVTPDIQEDINIVIDEKDLRVDTYRASGAGGQHVNKTDSAVRLTHLPTGFAVACQTDRSQHRNKERAMKLLKIKLYELEREKHQEKMDGIKGARKKIDFGSQIRSYVMQPYRMVKDTRTSFETSNVDSVMDGELDGFIDAYLNWRAG